MLSRDEIRAILETTNYYGESSYGEVGTGLWPAGVVAQLRGATFASSELGLLIPETWIDLALARAALEDCAKYTHFDLRTYCKTLAEEGAEFLKRFVL